MSNKAKIYCVAGLLLGDEGKGTTTEHIVRTTGSKLVTRWNGGPQPMHHIQLPDGRWHCFSQFGAGTLACLVPEVKPPPPPVKTLMSKYMLLSPRTLLVEASFLVKNFEAETDVDSCLKKYMMIDRQCFIVTPLHRLVNRVLEALRSDKDRYGTTGMGVGNAVTDVFHNHPELLPRGLEISKVDDPKGEKIGNLTCLQIIDFEDPKRLFTKLQALFNYKTNQVTQILNTYRSLRSGKRTDMARKLFNEKYRRTIGVKEIVFKEDNLKRAEKVYFDFVNQYTIDVLHNLYRDFAERFASTCFVDGIEVLKKEIQAGNPIVFEGAQGCLLDRVYGIFPHITKTLCSNDNILSLLREVGMREGRDYDIKFFGVFRGYTIRHGHGPLVTNSPSWNRKGIAFEEPHNQTTIWQGAFRSGPFDQLAMRYGISIFGKVDFIALTCLDRMIRYYKGKHPEETEKEDGFPEFPICNGYIVPTSVEGVGRILQENRDRFDFEKIEAEDGRNQFIVTKLKKGPLEKSYKSLDLLKLMKWSQARYIGMDESRDSLKNRPGMTEEEERLRKVAIREIYKRGLCDEKVEGDRRVAEKMGDYVVLVQRILEVRIGSLSFGPCYTDKIWVHNILE